MESEEKTCGKWSLEHRRPMQDLASDGVVHYKKHNLVSISLTNPEFAYIQLHIQRHRIDSFK